MPLISPSEYKEKKNLPTTGTTSVSSGLISPSDYKSRVATSSAPVESPSPYLYDEPAGPPAPVATAKAPELPGRDVPVLGWLLRAADKLRSTSPMKAIAEYSVPDAPLLDKGKPVAGTNAREDFLKRTGAEPATGVSKFVGQAVAPFAVPGAGLGAGVELYKGAEQALAPVAGRFGQGLGGKVAQGALKETAVGVPIGAGIEMSQGTGDLGEAAKQGAYMGAAGAALGAAGPLLSVGAKKAIAGLRERQAGRAVTEAVENTGARLPEEPPSVKEVVNSQPELPTMAKDSGELGFAAFGKKGEKFTNPEDTRTYIATKTDKEPVDWTDRVNRFYEQSFDNLQRINQFDKTVEQATGKKLAAADRSHLLALNQRGADMTARHILTEQLVDSRGNVIGPSLKAITQQIPKRAYTNFKDYLIAKHAETRMAPERGERVYPKETNMTLDKVKDKIDDYERTYPEFKKIADQLYDWNDKMTQAWLVDTGIITPETATAWKDANPYWIPNKRQFSELEKRQQATGAKRGFANQNNPVKGYGETGSERPIVDPFESLIEYTDRYVKTARRNEVMQSLIRNVEKAPDDVDGFAKVLRREKVDPKTAMDTEGAESLMDSLDNEFLKKSDLTKDNVVSALVNGERVYVRVEDPALLDALTNLGPQADSMVIAAARKATNAVKLLTTGANPIFSLTRNFFRDVPSAYIFSKTTNNPYRFAVDMLDAVVSTLGNKDLYKRYKALGGGHSSPVAADRNLLAQSKREILPQQKEGLGLLPRIYHGIENLNNAIESAPRLAEFKRVTKAGGNSYSSKQQGIFEANDVTTNFKRHGTAAKQADAVFLYLNAALQGLDKFVRAWKDNPKALAAKAAGAISVPTIVMYAINHDNPEYQKLSNYTKDNFLLFPTGDKDNPFIKIPKPRELAIPFSSMLERTMRAWWDQDPESFRDFSDTVISAFSPPGVPAKELAKGDLTGAGFAVLRDTIGGGFADLGANENFASSPIVPKYLEGVSPRNQYDANTSEAAKFVGDVLNQSPKKIDHLIRSYTGVLGQIGLPATTQGSTLGGTLAKQMTADPVFSTDASKFFYELKDKVDTQYKDGKMTGVVPEGYNDNVRKFLDDAASIMGDYTKALRDVDKMTALSSEEKKDRKLELTEQRNEVARKAYTAAKAAR